LTLREFAEALRLTVEHMEKDPSLRLTFRGLTDEAKAAWEVAIQFFDTNEKALNEIRKDIGGHFGQKAALNAIAMLLPEAYRQYRSRA
jgi:DNA-directed RNA polymerase subunit F